MLLGRADGIGRTTDADVTDETVTTDAGATDGTGPTVELGVCIARDGSAGAAVELDLDRPHAGLVVGKRGAGKSHTLGVLAEGLAAAEGTLPVVVDPMGAFGGLGELPGARVLDPPQVRAAALPPRAWCGLLELSPSGAVGGLVWRAAAEADTLDGMRAAVEDADAVRATELSRVAEADGAVEIERAAEADGAVETAARVTRRAAANHLRLAAEWGVFAPDGLAIETLDGPTVLDCSSLPRAPTNAVVHAVAAGCYRARIEGRLDGLPWLLVDEAGATFDGVAAPALERVLTRGRAPGVSLVAATQRPAALPDVAVSQADLVIAHRLTAEPDLAALERARPAYARAPLSERLPAAPGEAVVIDDATEAVHAVRVRERRTPHGGASPRASGVAAREADRTVGE